MRNVGDELKALRLYGMVDAWNDIIAQGTLATVESSRWLIEHLLDAEHTQQFENNSETLLNVPLAKN